MYGKIFTSIYDGTLRLNWKALITFQQMLVLSDAHGVLDMTPFALHGRTGIPIDILKEGIVFLEAPDKSSRTTDEDGRRIVRLDPDNRDWGWLIVNKQKYRDMHDIDTVRAQTRERVRRHREKSGNVTVTDGNASKRHTYTDTYTNTKTTDTGENSPFSPAGNCPKKELIELYHTLCPTLPKVVKWTMRREATLRQRWREHPHIDLWRQYFQLIARSKFLTGKISPRDKARRPFVADFDWLINATNFAKVLEGKYDNDG